MSSSLAFMTLSLEIVLHNAVLDKASIAYMFMFTAVTVHVIMFFDFSFLDKIDKVKDPSFVPLDQVRTLSLQTPTSITHLIKSFFLSKWLFGRKAHFSDKMSIKSFESPPKNAMHHFFGPKVLDAFVWEGAPLGYFLLMMKIYLFFVSGRSAMPGVDIRHI